MSVWTIYSIGDAAFLKSVLNGVGMIFSSGITGSLAAIALVLAVILQGFLGSLRGSGISFGQLLMVFLLYLLFFVPRADVAIHDVYSGRVYPVSGVPLGMAAAGGIVSGIGRKTAAVFETAFQVPEAEKHGFANSLMLLYRLREVIGKSRILADAPDGRGSFAESWKNYFRECTLVGIDIGTLAPDKIFQAENIISGTAFLSDVYGTAVNTGSGLRNLTCREAHEELRKYSGHVYMPFFISRLRGASGNTGTGGFPENAIGTPDIRNALDAVGKSGVSVNNYMLAAVLLPLYREAAREKYQDQHAFSAAVMLSDAIQSRNAEMAAEESMFFNSVRPFLTFFEALVYAMSPFMCFVLLLGAGGLTLLGRYLLLMVWIQLWQPLMAVVNLYILMSGRKALSAMAVPPESWEGLAAVHETAAEYLGIGGMLAAGVPVLATLVLYGGVQGLQSFAGRLAGRDHLNSHVLAPESATAPALVQQSPVMEMGRLSGGVMSGGQSFLPAVSFSGTLDKAISSAAVQARSSEEAFQESLENARASSKSRSVTESSIRSAGESIAASSSEAAGIINGKSREIAERLGLSRSETSAVRGALGFMLSGAASDTGSLASLSLSRGSGTGKQSQTARLAGELESASRSSELKTSYSEAVSRDIARGVSENAVQGISETAARSLQKSARKAVQDRKELSDLRSERSAFGTENRFDGGTVSRFVSRNPSVMKRLMELNAADISLSGRTEELMPLMTSVLPDRSQAYAAAALTALNEKSPVQGWELVREALGIKKGSYREIPHRENTPPPGIGSSVPVTPPKQKLGVPEAPPAQNPRGFYEERLRDLRARPENPALDTRENTIRRDMLMEPVPAGSFLNGEPGERDLPGVLSGKNGGTASPAAGETSGIRLSLADLRVYEAFRKRETLSSDMLREFEEAHPDGKERYAMINRLKAAAAGNREALDMLR